MHRLRPAGPGEPVRYLADDAEYDCGSDLLCCLYWPCNSFDPVPGLIQTTVSRKGEGATAPHVLNTTFTFFFYLCIKKNTSKPVYITSIFSKKEDLRFAKFAHFAKHQFMKLIKYDKYQTT